VHIEEGMRGRRRADGLLLSLCIQTIHREMDREFDSIEREVRQACLHAEQRKLRSTGKLT
jgi:hypothetical protein